MLSPICPAPRRAVLMGAVAMAAAMFAAGQSLADPAPAFLDLVQQARTTAPRLAISDADVSKAEGLRRQAAARPNPTVDLQAENFAGSGLFRGLSQTETTLSVAQPIELGGKRPARIAVGDADLGAARLRRDQDRAAFTYDLAAAYVDADAADQRVMLAEGALSLAEDDLRVAKGLVTAGKEAELRSLSADAAVGQARAEVQAAKAARATAFNSLTALVGSPVPLTSLSESLLGHADRMEPLPDVDATSTPTYAAAQAEREAASRRVRLERTRAIPDVTVSVGVRRLNGADSSSVAALGGAGRAATAFVGGVSIPFPVFDQNRGNISAAQADLRAADARLNEARLDAEADIRSALAQATAAEGRVAAALQGQKSAEEAYRLTRTGYEGGKLALLEVINARRALAESNNQLLNARIGRLSAEAALARLQGRIPFGDRP